MNRKPSLPTRIPVMKALLTNQSSILREIEWFKISKNVLCTGEKVPRSLQLPAISVISRPQPVIFQNNKSTFSSSLAVKTENKHKPKDLDSNSCVEIVSKRNVISESDLQEIERVFSMQVDFKPILSSPNRSPKKKSTKLRKLSREAETDDFE